MKEWNILVDYIDFYIYDKDFETVTISDSPEAGKAKEVYESFLEKYNIKNKDKHKQGGHYHGRTWNNPHSGLRVQGKDSKSSKLNSKRRVRRINRKL